MTVNFAIAIDNLKRVTPSSQPLGCAKGGPFNVRQRMPRNYLCRSDKGFIAFGLYSRIPFFEEPSGKTLIRNCATVRRIHDSKLKFPGAHVMARWQQPKRRADRVSGTES